MNDNQVKSRERVSLHGEVFTSKREVNAMLDLVKDQTMRIDSRFLEPACGTGNFLAEVLRRKLDVVEHRYGANPADFERFAVLAVSSIYGVELLVDNTIECRKRLFHIFNCSYEKNARSFCSDECREAVKYILERNILCGNALTLLDLDNKPITFSEWSLVSGDQMKRRDFHLSHLMNTEKNVDPLIKLYLGWDYDEKLDRYIPKPIKEFPLCHYRKVHRVEENK